MHLPSSCLWHPLQKEDNSSVSRFERGRGWWMWWKGDGPSVSCFKRGRGWWVAGRKKAPVRGMESPGTKLITRMPIFNRASFLIYSTSGAVLGQRAEAVLQHEAVSISRRATWRPVHTRVCDIIQTARRGRWQSVRRVQLHRGKGWRRMRARGVALV